MTQLDGKVIVVTGCASGIGARTTELIKERGAHVLGVDINPTDNADEFFQADLSDPNSIDALVERLPSGINGLANIAGVPPTAAAALVIKVNLIGLKRLTNKIIPKLADNASIVNLASLAGFGWMDEVEQIKAGADIDFDAVDDFIAEQKIDAQQARSYFYAKEALMVWTIKNRWTWRERGIRMNCVSPAAVDTPILKDFVETLGARATDGIRATGRPGTPDDIAPVVAFLLSDDSVWLRGANITSDGGMAAHFLETRTGI